MPEGWSADPRNLHSPEIVAAVQQALGNGIVCGVHAFYGGGGGPEPCAFIDFDSYARAVDGSRPGDWFTLWSIASLGEQHHLLVWKRKTPITEIEVGKVRTWLNENTAREFIAVGHSADSSPDAIWGDSDALDDLRDLAHRCAPTGEFAVLPMTDLLVESDSRRWIPRLHLVNAKRANDKGEVPVGGAY